MNPILEEIIKTSKTILSSGEQVSISPYAVSQEEGMFLQDLITKFQPKTTLEIGLAYGVSSLFICEALVRAGGQRHIIIDSAQSTAFQGGGLHNLRKAGYGGLLEFFEMRSAQALPQLLEQKRLLDFAFIDGWHTFDYALVDFFYVDKMLKVGGIVVFDDADFPGIRKLCRYIATNRSYSVIVPERAKSDLKFSSKRMILDGLLRIPLISRLLHVLLKPEIIESDKVLGLSGSIIAFKKESEDNRKWNFHDTF